MLTKDYNKAANHNGMMCTLSSEWSQLQVLTFPNGVTCYRAGRFPKCKRCRKSSGNVAPVHAACCEQCGNPFVYKHRQVTLANGVVYLKTVRAH